MRRLLPFAAALAVAAAGCTPPAFKHPMPPKPADPVADAGAHEPSLHEWWYWTGHLRAPDGRRFGFELTFFRVKTPPGAHALGLFPAWWIQRDVLIGHFALTDVSAGRFRQQQRTDAAHPKDARVDSKRMSVVLGDWSAQQVGSYAAHHLEAGDGGEHADLVLRAVKAPVLHGDRGEQATGSNGTSWYVSETRMEATGSIEIDGETIPVDGIAWHDHQWGSWKTSTIRGWDWYGLQLDDGSELMLYDVDPSHGAGIENGGSVIATDDAVTSLGPADFRIAPTGRWTSPEFGRDYPMGWLVDVPSKKLSLTVKPELEDQEFDGRRSIGVVYWEGAVSIQGTRDGKPLGGEGYVELTNYGCAPIPVPPRSGPLPCPDVLRKLATP